jgi:hypothetical protein
MVTLNRLEELRANLPVPKPQIAYNGCLSTPERALMADIYKAAGLRPVKPSARKFQKYRKEF